MASFFFVVVVFFKLKLKMKHFKTDLYRGFRDNGKSSCIVNMNPVIVALLVS